VPENPSGTGFFESSGYGSRDDTAKYGVTKRNLTMPEVAYYAQMMFPTSGGIGVIFTGKVAIMTAIAWAESGGDTQAHNAKPPDDSYGLWQINMLGSMGARRRAQFGIKDNKELFNPATNAMAAKAVYQEQGYSAWSVYTSGKYKQHLEAAKQAAENPVKPGGVGGDPSQADTIIGGVILDNLVNPILDFFKTGALRIAGFAVGIVLVILAVRMYQK
jgi:hypothetical protein